VPTRATPAKAAFSYLLDEFDYRSHLSVRSKIDLCRVSLGAWSVILSDPSSVLAGDSSAPAPAVTARSALDEAVRILPVFFDSTMAAEGFPSPLLRVRIGEHEATFLVDSGASTHVLADWFVKAASITSSETDSTVQGSSGKSASERIVHQLQGAWSNGRSFNLDEAVVGSTRRRRSGRRFFECSRWCCC
jgi:aspartyl protease